MAIEHVYEQIASAIVAGDKAKSLALVEDALQEGVSPTGIIEKGMSPGMKKIGNMFALYEIFLPEMMMAAEAFEHAMKVLEKELLASGGERKKVGRVVIGTVKGDIHSIGKNIVAVMLKMNGFEVFDLGNDVTPSTFVTKAEEVGADVIAASALMATTLPQQKTIVEHLQVRGERERYCVLVGGGCTTQEWANSIGADGYGKTAADAVNLALKAVTSKEAGR